MLFRFVGKIDPGHFADDRRPCAGGIDHHFGFDFPFVSNNCCDPPTFGFYICDFSKGQNLYSEFFGFGGIAPQDGGWGTVHRLFH